MTLSSSSTSHQPVKSPRQSPCQSPYTSGIHSASAAYRGNDPLMPNQFIGRQSPCRTAKWERLTMTVPIAAVHLAGGYERLIDSL